MDKPGRRLRIAKSQEARQRGFSLIEILVAFVILSLVMGVVYGLLSSGSDSLRLSRDYSRAALLAESLLAEQGREAALAVGSRDGELAGGYHWLLETRVIEDWQPEFGPQAGALPYLLVLRLTWKQAQQQRQYQVTTIRVKPAVEDGTP